MAGGDIHSLFRHYEDPVKAPPTCLNWPHEWQLSMAQGILFRSLFLLFDWPHNCKEQKLEQRF